MKTGLSYLMIHTINLLWKLIYKTIIYIDLSLINLKIYKRKPMAVLCDDFSGLTKTFLMESL